MKNKEASSAYIKEIIDDRLVFTLLEPPILNNALNFTIDKKAINELLNIKTISLDLSNVEKYDSFLTLFIDKLENEASKRNIVFEVNGENDAVRTFLQRMKMPKIQRELGHSPLFNYFENVGKITKILFSDTILFIEFVGSLFTTLFKSIFKPSILRWADFPALFLSTGVNAAPIVALIVFLIGLILGFQGAVQLKQFGADIYLADMIGISITRELGPLMTAIIIAGRSGSAFAAEIGSMKVSEEIDALSSMGFDQTRFLTAPRVIAGTLAAPLLAMIANVFGNAGGLLVGFISLKLTLGGYLNQLQQAIHIGDVAGGLFKAAIFGFLVSSIGCFRGLQARGGAESVGRYTTAAVVSGILLIIFSDALFTLVFQALGI
jgi:phospholipid/cholesterol/gamma-HCH transport system permease protein